MVSPIFRDWTQQDLLETFSYDKVTGKLKWTTGPRKGKDAGWKDSKGYTLVRYKGVLVRSHNLIWLMFKGEWPTFEVDHINNNPDDNTIHNLRKSSRKENCSNQKLQTRRFGGFKGVHKNKTSYYVKLKHNGKQVYGGSFNSEHEAAMKYNILAETLFGKFARFNIVFEDTEKVDTW